MLLSIILKVAIVSLILIILSLNGYRFYINLRIRKVEQQGVVSHQAKRKLRYIKEKEQSKHIQVFLVNGFLIGLVILCVSMYSFQTEKNVEVLQAESRRLNDETYALKKEQKQLITKIPVETYPKKGLNLVDYSWEKLFQEEKKTDLQSSIENDLSERLVPYFGYSTCILSIDIPTKTLSLSLVGDSNQSSSKEIIEENIKKFVVEAKDVPKLTQVHFQINNSSEKNTTVYSCTYDRKDDKQSFKLVDETSNK
ncbi:MULTISPECIES: hypothetical protein [Enterococcus]|uniref:Uncharacterized protein n=1 Tax=Candidatus Enterococcus ferrettii TaxID=2815324 RepID=A0ABV0EL46_9ENTE|nr:hypothetical protein [Enterococcus sp. 665A]MBO1343055.1 hypothetical protein [Enterococcus sp. 665A]